MGGDPPRAARRDRRRHRRRRERMLEHDAKRQDADDSANDTLVTVDTASIVSEMRSWCVEGGSDLDTEAGATVKLPLADGTILTYSVAIGG